MSNGRMILIDGLKWGRGYVVGIYVPANPRALAFAKS